MQASWQKCHVQVSAWWWKTKKQFCRLYRLTHQDEKAQHFSSVWHVKPDTYLIPSQLLILWSFSCAVIILLSEGLCSYLTAWPNMVLYAVKGLQTFRISPGARYIEYLSDLESKKVIFHCSENMDGRLFGTFQSTNESHVQSLRCFDSTPILIQIPPCQA